MRCPRLSELPPPPAHRSGWPWSEESAQLPNCLPNGSQWPRISIVTACLNQGGFIEETIRSVLLQGYPNLEYIIMDGGSTDNSIEIIKRYEPWLDHWVSERDEGQAAALAQGFSQARGDVFAWINSDDLYMANTFGHVVLKFFQTNTDIVFGNMLLIDQRSNIMGERRLAPYVAWLSGQGILFGGYGIYQPAAFWSSKLYADSGGIDVSFRFAMDTDLIVRFVMMGAGFKFVRRFLAGFRVHSASKSSNIRHVAGHEYRVIVERLPRCSLIRRVIVRAGCWGWRLAYHISYFELKYLQNKSIGPWRWVP